MKPYLFYLFVLLVHTVSAQSTDEQQMELLWSMVMLFVVTFGIIFLFMFIIKKFVKIKPDTKKADGWHTGGAYAGGEVKGASVGW